MEKPEKEPVTKVQLLMLIGGIAAFVGLLKACDSPDKPARATSKPAEAVKIEIVAGADRDLAQRALGVFRKACPGWFGDLRKNIGKITIETEVDIGDHDPRLQKLGWTQSATITVYPSDQSIGTAYWLGAGEEPGISGGEAMGSELAHAGTFREPDPCHIEKMHPDLGREFRAFPGASVLRSAKAPAVAGSAQAQVEPPPVDIAALFDKPRGAVLKALGKPAESDYADNAEESFKLGNLGITVRYHDKQAKYFFISTEEPIALNEIRSWSGLKTSAGWKITDSGYSSDFRYLQAISTELPKWKPRLDRLLARKESQVRKELKAFQQDDSGYFRAPAKGVTIFAAFDDDGKAKSLSIDMSEGIDAVTRSAEILSWAGAKPDPEEQRFNDTMYKISTSGHGIFFERRLAPYTRGEIDRARGQH